MITPNSLSRGRESMALHLHFHVSNQLQQQRREGRNAVRQPDDGGFIQKKKSGSAEWMENGFL